MSNERAEEQRCYCMIPNARRQSGKNLIAESLGKSASNRCAPISHTCAYRYNCIPKKPGIHRIVKCQRYSLSNEAATLQNGQKMRCSTLRCRRKLFRHVRTRSSFSPQVHFSWACCTMRAQMLFLVCRNMVFYPQRSKKLPYVWKCKKTNTIGMRWRYVRAMVEGYLFKRWRTFY